MSDSSVSVPPGYCQCGCGTYVGFLKYPKDRPKRFARGHWNRVTATAVNRDKIAEYRRWWAENTDVPYGYCWCGCGEKTNLARKTVPESGWVWGQPKRFIAQHQSRHFSREYEVEDRGYETPCWISNRIKNRHGYAWMRNGGHMTVVHRVFYEREHGPIPPGLEVDHLCSQRACCRPSHLEAVVRTENIRRSNRTKLTRTQAEEIRQLYATGQYSQSQLARKYGIVQSTANAIILGKNWQE